MRLPSPFVPTELVKKGCDRASLQSLAFPQAEPISQKEAEKAAALLQEAAETVSQVNRTALVAQLDPDRRFVGLDNLLDEEIYNSLPPSKLAQIEARDS